MEKNHRIGHTRKPHSSALQSVLSLHIVCPVLYRLEKQTSILIQYTFFIVVYIYFTYSCMCKHVGMPLTSENSASVNSHKKPTCLL